MINACGKDVLLESVNIFLGEQAVCCVLGVEYYSEAPEPQTNKRKRILNVQSSVLSKFGVEDSEAKRS